MRLEIKNIRKGDHFWERSQEFVAIEDATSTEVELFGKMAGQHRVRGKSVTGGPLLDDPIVFMETEGTEHYGPKLQDRNVYKDVDLFPDMQNTAEVKMHPLSEESKRLIEKFLNNKTNY